MLRRSTATPTTTGRPSPTRGKWAGTSASWPISRSRISPTFKNTYSGFMNGKAVQPPNLYFPAASVAFGWPDSYNKLHQLYLNECDKFSKTAGWDGQAACSRPTASRAVASGRSRPSVPTRPAGTRNRRAPLPPMGSCGSPGGPWPPCSTAMSVCAWSGPRTMRMATPSRTQPAPPGHRRGVPKLTPFEKAEVYSQSFTDFLPSLNLKYRRRRTAIPLRRIARAGTPAVRPDAGIHLDGPGH